ncbi:MAG: LptF/LptG family permease [Treponema sp.]|nr:LptF/LptG family permease [Treponema sp.]MDY4985818.1 LptF/LptG family permease [Treponema sp.]
MFSFEGVKNKIKNIYSPVDDFLVTYLHKGELGNNILVKYILKELLVYFVVAFLVFFMIFFVNQILLDMENLLSKSAPIDDVMRIMVYSIPMIIAQSAPYATLVGFLMCLGGMMSNNEILIFRAAGFSFFRILVPVISMGLLISIVSFFVNDYLMPLGRIKYNKLLRNIMQSTPTIELESNSVKHLDNSNIIMGTVTDNTVSDLVLFNTDGDSDTIIIAGDSSLIGSKKEGVLMELTMNDATVISINRNEKQNFDVLQSSKSTYNVFETTVMGTTRRSAGEMTTYDLKKEIKRLKEENGDESYVSFWIMEFYKKFSIPFGSLFFSFLAFSIAFLFGKHNGLTMGLFLGIIICVLNWAMQILGQMFVVRVEWDPFWCIWVPNMVVGILGFIFYLVLVRK